MTVPTIDRDGEVGEVSVPRALSHYVQDRFPKMLLGTVLDEREGEHVVVPDREVFQLKTMAFAIDAKRHCYVDIYVSEEFNKKYYVNEPMRDKVNEDWVRKRAAWFFTYGRRDITK